MQSDVSVSSNKKLNTSYGFSLQALIKYRYFYLMLLPGLIYILLFHYIPMLGLVIAFKDFKIFKGVLGSPWVGLENFQRLLESAKFYIVMRNTFLISFYKILFGFPIPILLAILINEVKSSLFRRSVQTIVYLPHFISWVVTAGLVINFLSPSDGFINMIIKSLGGEPIFFMGEPRYFRLILVASDIWKEMGWNAIIYLAALASISQDMYEAAIIDGANRLQRIIYISIPGITSTIVIMLLLRMGGILNAGFEQIFSMYNAAVYDVADIIDTYVYRIGIVETKFGFSTAVGLFKSVIACTLVLTSNWFAKKVGQENLF